MGRYAAFFSTVPWWLPDSDLREADGGEPALRRDLLVNGKAERHFGLHVWGQVEPCPPSLGLVAVRCERQGSTVIPISLSIPDTPITIETRRAPALVAPAAPTLDEYPDRESD